MNQKQKEYLQMYKKEFLKLFPQLDAFANKYFVKNFNEFMNAVDFRDEESFPDGYIPSKIEIYYGKAHSPHLYIIDGVLSSYELLEREENYPSVTLIIDSNFAYIQVEGQEILNKMGGVILPEIILDPSIMLSNIIQEGNRE